MLRWLFVIEKKNIRKKTNGGGGEEGRSSGDKLNITDEIILLVTYHRVNFIGNAIYKSYT